MNLLKKMEEGEEEDEEWRWGSRRRRKEDEARKEKEPKGIMLKEQPYKLKKFLVMLCILKPKCSKK